jgi:uncharacterized RDD family membrane protein YckC
VNHPNWYAPPAAATLPSALAGGSASDDPLDRAVYGRFWIRAGAQVVDSIATVIFSALAGVAAEATLAILQAAEVIDDGWARRMGQGGVGGLVVGLVAAIGYRAVAEWIGGATIGKLAFGLRVRSLDLSPCTLSGALLRNLFFPIDGQFIGLIAYLSMNKSPRKQRLGDKIGRTVVVRTSSLGEPRPSAKRLVLGVVAGAVLAVAIELLQMVLTSL